jgi:putative NIF3 family GTP cyclohydrolase 1 type 2
VKTALSANSVQVVGANTLVQRIAIACGAAGEFLHDAVRQKADVFLTGEVRFHDCLTAQAQRLALVLPGHYASERGGIERLATQLQQQFPTLHVWPSRAETDPLRLV